MAGTKNDVLVGKNADFSQVNAPNGTTSESNGLVTDGKLWIGSTAVNAGGTHINVGTITSPGATVTVGFSSPNITLEAGATVPTTFTADSGSATPAANNLNVLGGVNCSTSGSGSTITVDVVGIGTTWVEVTGTSVSAAVNTGYILNNAGLVTVNLPGTCAVGDEIRLAGKGAGLWVADAPAGDTIHFGNQDTSSGGTITATNRYDCLHLLCTVANSEWTVLNSVGNLTVA